MAGVRRARVRETSGCSSCCGCTSRTSWQVCSRHTADLDAGLPARGLNGEAYRGHVFWDEIYAFPFFNVRLPEVTRGLLMYRYRRIGEARAAAQEAGLRGAMFPWQSGSEGIEETQRVHLNPLSGRWEPDLSRNQRHVNAAIFYNIWHYFQTTHDQAFLSDYGAEMMLEIARFWASIAHFNPDRERYEIHGVMGPDEFHEKYPDAPRRRAAQQRLHQRHGGVAVRHRRASCCRCSPPSRAEALRGRLGIGDDELATWQDMSRRMFVPFHGDGIISQFEGYDDLEELDWDAYRAKYGNIQRLDRILRAEGDDPNRYKLTKQADTVMLFFLFTARRATRDLRAARVRLPCRHGACGTSTYYDRRTSHGSTLSFVTHAGVLAALDPDSSWDRFLVALRQRCRRHPGRHDEGRHPHGCHVRDTRRRAAGLRGHPCPRRRPVLRSPAPEAGSTACRSRCSSRRPRSSSRSPAIA